MGEKDNTRKANLLEESSRLHTFTEELECGVIDGLCKTGINQLPCACQLKD